MRKDIKITLVIFNTLANNSEFWGNLQLSLCSGELKSKGIDNDIIVIILKPDAKKENEESINRFIKILEINNYDIVIFHSCWLPWLKEKIKNINKKMFVVSLDSLQEKEELLKKYPILSDIFHQRSYYSHINNIDFNPNFDYIFIGNDSPVIQRLTHILDNGCPYSRNLSNNNYFKDLDNKKISNFKGCSYCFSATSYKKVNTKNKVQFIVKQIKYYQKKLPHLQKLSIPHPEDFLLALKEIVLIAEEEGIKPLSFFVQFRPDVIVKKRKIIESLLKIMRGTNFSLYLPVVGFENFSKKELEILNRGYEPEVSIEAIKILKKLSKDYHEAIILKDTVASFILFNPFTELEDIEINLKNISNNDFSIFKNINFNKVRINPNVPLYYLADKYNLISKEFNDDNLADLPRGGYFEDYNYKFKDKKIEFIYKNYTKFENKTSSPEKIVVLKKLLDYIKNK